MANDEPRTCSAEAKQGMRCTNLLVASPPAPKSNPPSCVRDVLVNPKDAIILQEASCRHLVSDLSLMG